MSDCDSDARIYAACRLAKIHSKLLIYYYFITLKVLNYLTIYGISKMQKQYYS